MNQLEDTTTSSTARHVSRSRQFWELKAEQVLNRVFEQAEVVSQVGQSEKDPVDPGTNQGCFTDVEVRDLTPGESAPKPLGIQAFEKPSWRIITTAGVTATVLLGVYFLINQQQALQQERNLMLLSQLRRVQDPSANPDRSHPINGGQQADLLPPAPPTEPWMEELARLPQTGSSGDNLLRVPLHGPLGTPTSPSQGLGSGADGSSTSMPQLVGIIQGAGKGGSAIFQTGGSSTSVATGETIGSTGWRLRAATGDSAIIEQGGQQRRLSIAEN